MIPENEEMHLQIELPTGPSRTPYIGRIASYSKTTVKSVSSEMAGNSENGNGTSETGN